MAMGLVAIPLQIVSGDFNARFLYDVQPTKIAAMEGVYHTEKVRRLRLAVWPILKRGRCIMPWKFQTG